MRRDRVRTLMLGLAMLISLGSAACGGKRFYPVRGQVLVNGKPPEGVMIILHPLDSSDPEPVQPSAIVKADGSFELKSYLVRDRVLKDGAPAGEYHVTCTWYPPDLQKYLGMEKLPDKLGGKYANPKTSGLRAVVREEATELPVLKLDMPGKKS